MHVIYSSSSSSKTVNACAHHRQKPTTTTSSYSSALTRTYSPSFSRMLTRDQQQQFRNHSIISKKLSMQQQQQMMEDNLSDDDLDELEDDNYNGDIDADDEDEDNAHQVLNMLSHTLKDQHPHLQNHQQHQLQQFHKQQQQQQQQFHPREMKMTSPSATSQMINFKMKSSSTSHIPQISAHPLLLNPQNQQQQHQHHQQQQHQNHNAYNHHSNNSQRDNDHNSHPTLSDISHLISSPHPDDAAEAPSISSPSSDDMSGDDMSSPPQHQNFSSLSLHSPGKPGSKFNQFIPGIPSGGMMKSSSCSNIVPKTCNYNKCCICAYGPPPSFFTSAPTWADICYIALYCLTLSKPDIKYFHIKKDICTFIDSHYETMCMRKRTSIWRQTVNMTLSHPQYFEMFQQESALENGRKGYYGLKQIHDPYEHTALNKRSRRKRRHEQKMLQEELKKSSSFSTTISASKNQSPVNQIIGSIYSSNNSNSSSQQQQSSSQSHSQSSSPNSFVSPNDSEFIPSYELASISQQYKRVKCNSSSSSSNNNNSSSCSAPTPSSQQQTPTTQSQNSMSTNPIILPLPSISGKPPIQSPQLQHHHQQQQQQLQQHKKNFESILNSDDDMPSITSSSNSNNKRPLSSPIEKPQWYKQIPSSANQQLQDSDSPMSNASNSAQNTPSPIVKKFTQKTILPKLDDEEDELMENEREVPRLYNKSPMTKLILEKSLPPLSPTSLTQNTATNPLSNSPSPINSRSNSPCQQTPSTLLWQQNNNGNHPLNPILGKVIVKVYSVDYRQHINSHI
ncbi:putative homeobox transcription factor [Heterostelium album PN500]|uniref:Putative homeobox transcription factor n=1 Tax=Heterostelium pallidum (strain ATCC 26659 / Pp 5 / PN500) TaxID=670386 RepID=D3BQS1_HETP5|nr:putative homeobox transcription factor [Heterostelium album PN500]EFA76491.1 putative homeobox transcription factor [Heterostelium album PN500]|eukprot:XP_020428623.1 putative homeobox transcription factor [Heterostelium album PN500]